MLQKLPSTLQTSAFDFIVNASSLGDIEELTTAFLAEAGAFGISGATYVRLATVGRAASPEPLFGRGDERWGRAYAETKAVVHDPALPRIFQDAQPFSWRDLSTRALSREAVGVLGLAADHGLHDGFVVPLLGPSADVAAIIMTSQAPMDLAQAHRCTLVALATAYARRGLELTQHTSDEPKRLTGRERQCLAWAAEGKSDWAIGEILRLSSATVHMHVENARKKLGCRTRHHAALEAWRLGLLTH